MKKIPNEECASICGLFCGACPAFPDECHGCFSDFVRENCRNCADHGFLDCATSHNVIRCYECEGFPCDKLREFSTKPIINGICNHANVIPDSFRMKEVGVSQWISEKIVRQYEMTPALVKRGFTCHTLGVNLKSTRLTTYKEESS